MADSQVIVKINGLSVTGWTYATITASLERIPRTFELGVIQPVLGALGNVLAQPMEVWLSHGDGTADKVLTGYIDGVQDSLNLSDHEITFSGRGVCSDLVDSSTELTNNSEIQGLSAFDVAQRICTIYDIKVVEENELALIPYNYQVPVNVGDSAYTAIEYIARANLCLLYEDEHGQLVLGSTGSEGVCQTTITHLNAIHSTLHFDISSVFGDYEILAVAPQKDVQAQANDTPVPTGKAHDPTFDNRVTAAHKVPRQRKFRKIESFIADPNIYGTQTPQQIYANYICNRLNGRAQSITVTVQGWTDVTGKLFKPNQTINIELLYQTGVALKWLIADCTYSISPEDGTTTTMVLMPATAFSLEPLGGQAADVSATLHPSNTTQNQPAKPNEDTPDNS